MRSIKIILLSLFITLMCSACVSSGGTSATDRRQSSLAMQNKVLAELYDIHPQARAEIANAPGYAVFSNANVNIIFVSFAGGYGVVTDNKTSKQTFMKMAEAGIGLGLGVKDFRAIFIFHDKATLDKFMNNGWEFGGHADAAAKTSDKGGAVGGEALIDGITVYQLTESGLALQATVKGTKYWKDEELN